MQSTVTGGLGFMGYRFVREDVRDFDRELTTPGGGFSSIGLMKAEGPGLVRALRACITLPGTLTAVSTGEGSVFVAEVDGPVVGRVAGSGVIEVKRGGAPEINVQVAGSGAVRFGGSAGAVIASVAGDGEVDVARVSGPVTRQIFGSGRIKVGP